MDNVLSPMVPDFYVAAQKSTRFLMHKNRGGVYSCSDVLVYVDQMNMKISFLATNCVSFDYHSS